jgi:predicted metal-dependent hydrolase
VNMKLHYRIVYSHRRTMSISVERDASVVVHAPRGTPEGKIRQAVEARKLWLFQKINHAQKYPSTRQRKEFVSGETIAYLGRNYRLEVVNKATEGVQFHSRFIIARQNQPQAARLFRQWYIDRAKERILLRTRYFAEAMGVAFNCILISDLKVRWGSCTPRSNLNFNWRILKAPSFVIDYIVVHELAHLIEANHTPRFWNIVFVQVPRWEQAKNWLREHGDLLEVDF